jgi:hypothetical protein
VQQLLDAAAEVIAASGVDNATTNAIAARGERGVLLLDQARRVIGHLLALRMPAVPAERLEWHAITAVEAAHALVVQASILPPERGEKLIEETVILLTRYLSPDYAPRTDAS